MRLKDVVVTTLSEDAFTEVESKLEELGVSIIEERYDLLYKRYEIYAKLNLRQRHKLRKFVKSHNVRFMELA